MPDYKEAKRELSDLLERIGVFALSDHTHDSDTTEEGPCRFRWTLHKGDASFSGTYQAGSAVPLHAYLDGPDSESFAHWKRSRWWADMPFGVRSDGSMSLQIPTSATPSTYEGTVNVSG